MNKFCLANYRVFQRHQPRLASAVLKHSDRVVHNARNTIPTRALAEDLIFQKPPWWLRSILNSTQHSLSKATSFTIYCFGIRYT